MKAKLAVLALLGLLASEAAAVALRDDNIWADAMEGVDTSEYSKDTPKAYTEAPKPKVDYKALEKKQK